MAERQYRTITFRSSGVELRTAKFEGRDHLVIPVVALVEGVIQAMNAPNPELVRAEVFSVAPSGWNGRPIFLDHPMSGNTPISGNTPEVLPSSFGRVFNAHVDGTRLLMEAWIDEEKAKELGGDPEKLLTRVRANKSIEISTGAFIVVNDKKGRYLGKAYTGEWETLIPDHLAILNEGATGACSYKMGCGVRAAIAFEVKGTEIVPLYAAEKKPMEKLDRAAVKKEYKNRSLLQRAMAFVGLMAPEDMGDMDLREELYYALRLADPTFRYQGDIVIVYPQLNQVVYSMYEPEGICYYRRDYTLDATSGEATVSDTPVECERVTTYEPIGQEDQLTAAMKSVVALAGARHSAKDQKMIQAVHDTAQSLGANCGVKASAGTCGCGNHAGTELQPATW
jgi:hypothetical protein